MIFFQQTALFNIYTDKQKQKLAKSIGMAFYQKHSCAFIFMVLTILFYRSTPNEINQTIACLKDYLDTFQAKLKPQLFRIFKSAFPNTLETTVRYYDLTKGKQQTYIITGDIEAMWLRDSTNQWLPYLKLQKQCPYIEQLTRGLINQQAQFIMIDPYTNAFKRFQKQIKQRPSYLNDTSEKLILGIPIDLCQRRNFSTKSIWERKFQIDSLASFLRLSYEYHNKYKELSFINVNFISALRRIITTLKEQIKDRADQKLLGVNYYTFSRNPKELVNGTIQPSSKTGMIKTGFRPSDDPNELPYNVPSNAMLASFLKLLSKNVLSKVNLESVFYNTVVELQKQMEFFATKIMNGINNYAIVSRPSQSGDVFAYEVDGQGRFKLYDDANLPSLLSLPYLEFTTKTDQIYKHTRALVLSSQNPFYYSKQPYKGEGSSHTPRNYIWPLALMVQILTSESDDEIRNCLYSLQMSAKDNLMHESFSIYNPKIITRGWFAWANSFFGEMIMVLEKTKPQLLK